MGNDNVYLELVERNKNTGWKGTGYGLNDRCSTGFALKAGILEHLLRFISSGFGGGYYLAPAVENSLSGNADFNQVITRISTKKNKFDLLKKGKCTESGRRGERKLQNKKSMLLIEMPRYWTNGVVLTWHHTNRSYAIQIIVNSWFS